VVHVGMNEVHGLRGCVEQVGLVPGAHVRHAAAGRWPASRRECASRTNASTACTDPPPPHTHTPVDHLEAHLEAQVCCLGRQ
jgi:hypothetical protein